MASGNMEKESAFQDHEKNIRMDRFTSGSRANKKEKKAKEKETLPL